MTQYREQLIRRLEGPAPSIPAMRDAAAEMRKMRKELENYQVLSEVYTKISQKLVFMGANPEVQKMLAKYGINIVQDSICLD